MTDVTQILSQIEQGDSHAAEQLLPLVYQELRKLATIRLAEEKPGQTLQATALVHEAYLKLVDVEKAQSWNSRGHFFAAAAEAMRRILIDQARKKRSERHGGGRQRCELSDGDRITLRELPEAIAAPRGAAEAEATPAVGDFSMRRARRRFESDLVRRALEATGGNRTRAAKLLEISYRALLYKIKEHGLGGDTEGE